MTSLPALLLSSYLHCREEQRAAAATSRPKGHSLPEFSTAAGAARQVCSLLKLKLPAKTAGRSEYPEHGSEIIRWDAKPATAADPAFRYSYTPVTKGTAGEWMPSGAFPTVKVMATAHTHVNDTFFSNGDVELANSRGIVIFVVNHSGTYWYNGKDGDRGVLEGDRKKFEDWLNSAK